MLKLLSKSCFLCVTKKTLMNAYEQLKLASENLRDIQAKELSLPNEVLKLKKSIQVIAKHVKAILDTLPEEQRLQIKEKLND